MEWLVDGEKLDFFWVGVTGFGLFGVLDVKNFWNDFFGRRAWQTNGGGWDGLTGR